MEAIDRNQFLLFCSKLWINSKEKGLVRLDLTTSQLYLLDQILGGLEDGKHHFIILKSRQAQASTLCMAFTLYWSFKHAGMIGSIVCEAGITAANFRQTYRDFCENLSKAEARWRQPVLTDNRDILSFGNQSRLTFMNANQKTKGGLGRGVGITMVHGTEVGRWKDRMSYQSLMSSVAQSNPNRLFLFESTANGNNLFKELCSVARRATTQKFIFIGWWIHDDYQVEENDPRYLTYWNGAFTNDERRWIDLVELRYKVAVNWPRRIAWWRWMFYEKFGEDMEALYQEYPPLPEDAFQFSGAPYISKQSLQEHYESSETSTENATYWRFRFGKSFGETMVDQVDGGKESAFYELTIWEQPRVDDRIRYALGVDPSYGVNEFSDQSVVCVLRCYADKVEQVAEFCSRGCPTYRLAWVTLALAALYQPAIINVEMAGGGQSVYQEIQRVETDIGINYPPELAQQLGAMRHYLYRRVDSLQANYTAIGSETTHKNRLRILSEVKNFFERGLCILHSPQLINEAAAIVVNDDGYIGAPEDGNDDRVFAFGLSIIAYLDNLMYDIGGVANCTYEAFKDERKAVKGEFTTDDFLSKRLTDFIKVRV